MVTAGGILFFKYRICSVIVVQPENVDVVHDVTELGILLVAPQRSGASGVFVMAVCCKAAGYYCALL